MRVERCLVDAGWFPDVVAQFVQRSPLASAIYASKGVARSATQVGVDRWKPRPGERKGVHWRLTITQEKRQPLLQFDPDHWKTVVHSAFSVPLGADTGLTLFGNPTTRHELFAEHLAAEYAELKPINGETFHKWQMSPNRTDNHWLDCYDQETEVLTRSGWKRFADVAAADELATVNMKTDLIEYQKPTAIIDKAYDGDMIQVGGGKHSRVNLCVTPGHRMVVFAGQASRGPVIKTAGELTIWDKIKTRAKWAGNGQLAVDIPSTSPVALPSICRHCEIKPASRARGLCWCCYYAPGVREKYLKTQNRRSHPQVTVKATDLAAFFGWYVAEGSCSVHDQAGKGKTYRVIISQNPGAKRDSICQLLDRLPWRYHVTKTGLVISNEQAYRLVCDLGNKYTKRVPQWIKDSHPEVIAEYVRCAVDGDGWRQRDSEAYATVSPMLAGDMQELYLKLGYGVSVTKREPKTYCIRGRSGKNTVPQYHVHRSDRRFVVLRDAKNNPNFRRFSYSGRVYCASVPNGTLIVRRGGKVAVCGNCVTGCAVAASVAGVSVSVTPDTQSQTPAKPRKPYSELQRERERKQMEAV
jgi:hypothetical protein